MATERRDIELAIRARDLSTADLRRVSDAVDSISASLEKQVEAARKGELSAGELRSTLEQLRQAGTALANQQGLVDTFVRLGGAIAKAEKDVEDATRALTEFNAQATKSEALTTKQGQRQANLANKVEIAARALEAAEKRQREYNQQISGGGALTEKQTARQTELAEKSEAAAKALDLAKKNLATFNAEAAKANAERVANQQERLEKALASSTARLENLRSESTKTATALNAFGIETNDLASAQQRIVTAANQIGAANTTISASLLAYAKNQRELTNATNAQARAEREAGKASEARAALVSRTLETVSQKLRERARLEQVARNAETAGAREAAIEAQKRIDENNRQIEGYRKLADTLERTAQGFKAVAVAQKGTTSTSTLDAVLAATGQQGGTNTATRRTLDGIEQVNASLRQNVIATENARGPVERYVDTLQDAERTLARVQAVAKQIDGYQTQADAVRRAEAAFQAAQEELRRYTAALRAPGGATEELANDARLAAERVRNLGATLTEQRGRLANLEQGLTETGVDTRNLARDQQRLAAVAKDTTESITRLNAAVRQRGVAEGDNFGIFGFRPYELQNLSFQVNDFFTQIASGTSVMQAFAQQIGQVIQIERVGTFLARTAPIAAGAAIGIGTLVAALVRLNSQFSLLRDANAQQVFRGGGFGGEEVLRAANNMARLGAAFADARRAALSFATLPLDLNQYRQATDIAGNLFAAFEDGERRVDALRDALSKGVRGLLEFDDQFGGLSAGTRQLVESARSATDQAVALDTALRELGKTAKDARDNALSPFGESVIELRNAWRTFLDTLASSGAISTATRVVEGLTDAIEDLAVGLGELGPLLPILGAVGGGLAAGIPGAVGGTVAGFAITGAVGDRIRAIRAARRQRQQESRAAAGGGGGGGATPPATPPRRDPADPQAATPEEVDEYFRALGEGQRQAAENDRRRLAPIRERLDLMEREARLDEIIRKGTDRRATAEERAASVRAAAEKAAAEFARERGIAENSEEAQRAGRLAARRQQEAVDEAARSAAEAGARSSIQARRRELAEIEQDIRSVEQQRNDATREIQEGIASGALSAVEGMRRLQQVADQTRPKFAELADEAERFVNANRGQDGLRDARADALISRTRRLAGGGGEQAANTAVLRQQQTFLQQAVQERATLIQTVNALEQQGAITSSDAQQRIRAAYVLTNDQITAQIDSLEALVIAQEQSGRIGETQAAAIRAQIELARAQLVFIDPEITRLRQTFEQTAASEGVRAFDEIAQSIGEAALNMRSFGDVTETTGRVVLNFFASLLRAIAQAILQQQILIAVQAISAALSGGATAAAGATRIPPRPAGIGGIGSARLGGVVGPNGIRNNAAPRRVDPRWFIDAPHYQSGGLPGLRPDEEAAILHRGEEVLTKDDPRNILNMAKSNGGGGGGEIGIRNVLVMDPEAISGALAGAEGERVIVNFLRKNAATVRQIVRG